tara:strand:- start:3021 stop:3308 length:288 start_codon:yes stop_codon:yes gene_type:complete
MSSESQMERLRKVREKASEISEKRKRMEWDKEQHEKRMGEITSEVKEKFNCEVDELPNLSKRLKQEAEKELQKAEDIMSVSPATVSVVPDDVFDF